MVIGRAQHAHASRDQLVEVGFTPAMIRTRLHRGVLDQRYRCTGAW
jgi:hypothetical protein